MCYKPYLASEREKVLDEIFADQEVAYVKIKDVINTEYNFCVISFADHLKCGGRNDRRQIPSKHEFVPHTTGISFRSSPFPHGVSDFAGAGDHLCAVVEGQARCWAGNSYAQSTGNTSSPAGDIYPEDSRPAALPEKADTVTASEGSSCARGASGSVYCWGTNRRGELGVAADIALPCATQNELDENDAKKLLANGCICVAEGANMPSTLEATEQFLKAGILYAPGKASNAGGVATSGLEMSQNAIRLSWTRGEVDNRLHGIMAAIHESCQRYGTRADGSINYVQGANVAGFVKVADAMLAQGIV